MINIAAIDYYLPENILTNEDIAREFPEWSAEKIKAKIGVEARHIVKKTQTALDLAYEATQNFLKITIKRRLILFYSVPRVRITFCLLQPVFYKTK